LPEQIRFDFVSVPQDVSVTGQGCRALQDRNVVLVVDDDPGMLKGVQRVLRRHEYTPVLFSSAEAFKNHADVEKAVCVILDINLNDGSGIELRHRLKADGHSVPVISLFLQSPSRHTRSLSRSTKYRQSAHRPALRLLMACSRSAPWAGDRVILTPIGSRIF
jgi:CheY-like chemotaxis protein